MTKLEWAEPPPPRSGMRGSVFSKEILATLRAHPGRWALVKHDHPSASIALKFKRHNPEFDATVRGSGGHFDIYARYVGDGQGPS